MAISDNELLRELMAGGLDQRAARALLNRFGDGGAAGPVGVVMYAVNGSGPGTNGADGQILLDAAPVGGAFNPLQGTITAPFQTVGVNQTPTCVVRAPAFSSGTLEISYCELAMVSASGTNKMTLANGPTIPLGPLAEHIITEWDDAGVLEHLGTDLTYTAGGFGPKSSAGGQYQYSLYVQLTVSSDFAL